MPLMVCSSLEESSLGETRNLFRISRWRQCFPVPARLLQPTCCKRAHARNPSLRDGGSALLPFSSIATCIVENSDLVRSKNSHDGNPGLRSGRANRQSRDRLR